MELKKSGVYKHLEKVFTFSLGELYFFENIVISQINEGAHISIENAQDLFTTIHNYYGNKSFGYISNRINKYSIEVLDYPRHYEILPNLKIYGVVGYSHFSEMNINIEKEFCKMPFIGFKNIESAYEYVDNYLITMSKKIA